MTHGVPVVVDALFPKHVAVTRSPNSKVDLFFAPHAPCSLPQSSVCPTSSARRHAASPSGHCRVLSASVATTTMPSVPAAQKNSRRSSSSTPPPITNASSPVAQSAPAPSRHRLEPDLPIHTGEMGDFCSPVFFFSTASGLPRFDASVRANFSFARRCCGVCACGPGSAA